MTADCESRTLDRLWRIDEWMHAHLPRWHQFSFVQGQPPAVWWWVLLPDYWLCRYVMRRFDAIWQRQAWEEQQRQQQTIVIDFTTGEVRTETVNSGTASTTVWWPS